MEDKRSHIDTFLEAKLGAFEASPNEQAWEAIAGNIAHLQHPIDLSLNNNLSDLNDHSEDDDLRVLDNALKTHPIDIGLREKLEALEASPDHTAMRTILAEGNGSKRKRRIAVWWLGGLFLIAGLGLMTLGRDWFQDQSHQITDIPAVVHSEQSSAAPRDLHGETQGQGPETGNPDKRKFDRIYTTKPNTVSQSTLLPGIDGISSDGGSGEVLTIDEASLDFIRPYPDFSKQYAADLELIAPMESSMRIVPTRRLSPFSLHLQVGYINQTSVGDKQQTSNIHKDAAGNFEKASGHTRNGSIFSLQASWAFKRFSVRCGLQYSSSSVTSHFDYVYNQLPLYDSMGNLVDYIIRPYAQSPHISEQVKTSSTSVSVPVQLYMQVGHIGRIGLWAGIGSDLVLSRKVTGRLFSYDDERMKDYRATSRLALSPHLSLMGQYRIKPGLALTANMQYAYATEHTSFEHAKFTRQQFIPSLRLGLLFTPIIRIK